VIKLKPWVIGIPKKQRRGFLGCHTVAGWKPDNAFIARMGCNYLFFCKEPSWGEAPSKDDSVYTEIRLKDFNPEDYNTSAGVVVQQ